MKSLSSSISSCNALLRSTRKDHKTLIFSLYSHVSHYSTEFGEDPPSSKVKIFDRQLKRKQRDRAAWFMRSNDSFVDTVAENLVDRLEDCKKKFPTALSLGGSLLAVRRLLRGRGAIEKLIMMDTSHDTLKVCREAEQSMVSDNIETSYVVGDEEFLPVAESSLDLVISCLGLHWTNDLPGAMIQVFASPI